jgi:hypothetical protein
MHSDNERGALPSVPTSTSVAYPGAPDTGPYSPQSSNHMNYHSRQASYSPPLSATQ